MRMSRARLPHIITGVLLLGLLIPAPQASAEASPSLGLKDIAFDRSFVDATSGGAVVNLRWTVTNANPAAQALGGQVFVRMRGSTPGTFVGQTYQIEYSHGDTFPGTDFAQYVSGPPQESTYEYAFVVPPYARHKRATWAVSKVFAQDELGATLTVEGSALRAYRSSLDTRSLVDSTPPTHSEVVLISNFSPVRPYAYVGGQTAEVRYEATMSDAGQSGFWKGIVELTGPGRRTVTAEVERRRIRGEPTCGFFGSGVEDPLCGILVIMPANAAAGRWTLTRVTVIDNAGNRATSTVNGPTITATSNAVLSAANFTATPNPVNNWTQDVNVEVGMRVTGALQGVVEIHIDTSSTGSSCRQLSSTPTSHADGTVSVPMRAFRGMVRCEVRALAVVDGSGNVALYGRNYGAPDPNLTITRLPNTTPPTATNVTLTPNTVPQSQLGSTFPRISMQVNAPVAPVTSYDLALFDATGNQVSSQFGGTGTGPGGQLDLFPSLPFDLVPGQYTFGFTLFDASDLRTSYGPPAGQPMPGGPLVLTVTPG